MLITDPNLMNQNLSTTKDSCLLWSAFPTPLTTNFQIDVDSLELAVEWQYKMGIDGLFAAGTCGEGACLTDASIAELVRKTVQISAGRMEVAAQVTDNSVPRVLDRIRQVQQAGASMGTLAPPLFELGTSERSLCCFYKGVLDQSPLPVCIYQLPRKTIVPGSFLEEIYQHPNLSMVKDSTGDAARQKRIFAVASSRPGLRVLSGVEIGYYDDFVRGFHGGMLGTAILNAGWARAMHCAVAEGNHELARAISAHIDHFLYEIFGGKPLRSWMGGLKACLKRMGIFASTTSYYDMPATPEVLAKIEQLVDQKFWEVTPDALAKLTAKT